MNNFEMDNIEMENIEVDTECSDTEIDVVLSEIESDDEMKRPGTPLELIAAAGKASEDTLPTKSKERYILMYHQFQKWKKTNKATSNSERVLMALFGEMAGKYKSSTLWSKYSMLKATMKIYENVDIQKYYSLVSFLKTKAVGYLPKQAKAFTELNIRKFIDEASDDTWLDVKVALIIGICGACRSHELPELLLEQIIKVEDMEDVYMVKIHKTKTNKPRAFAIVGEFYKIVEKYLAMRPDHATKNQIFLNYQKGKCTVQTIGKNKFYKMPERIAKFLKLPNPQEYTGHSFRVSSATVFANTGATIEAMKRLGGWISTNVAEHYITESIEYQKQTSNVIMSSINRSRASSTATTSNLSNTPSREPLANVVSFENDNGSLVEISSFLGKEESVATIASVKSGDVGFDDSSDDNKENGTQMSSQTILKQMDKRIAFYKCDNITINFNK